MQFGDATIVHRGNLNNRLVGADINNHLVLLNDVTFANLPFNDFTFNNAFAYIRQDKFFVHSLLLSLSYFIRLDDLLLSAVHR